MKEFEKITKKISELILSDSNDDKKITELVKQQDEIIKNMSEEEIDNLLSRNIPAQYKAKIHKLRG